MIDTSVNVDNFNNYSVGLVFVYLAKEYGLLTSFNKASFKDGFNYTECLSSFSELGILNSAGMVDGVNMIMKDCEIGSLKDLKGSNWDQIVSLYDMVNFDDKKKQLPFECIKGIYSIFYFFSNFDYDPLYSKINNKELFELELDRQIKIIKKKEGLNDA